MEQLPEPDEETVLRSVQSVWDTPTVTEIIKKLIADEDDFIKDL